MPEPLKPLPTSSGNVVVNTAKGLWDEVGGKNNVFKGMAKIITGKNAYEQIKLTTPTSYSSRRT